MDIALYFWEEFPSKNNISGQCFRLLQGKGQYRLGRVAEDGSSPEFEIDIQSKYFSRSVARITIYWNAVSRSWEISDSGFNDKNQLIVNPLQVRVNGELIPRNGNGYPDPVAIAPGDRLLLGGRQCRALVLAECETTLDSSLDLFTTGPWGIEEVEPRTEIQAEPETEDATVSSAILQDAMVFTKFAIGQARETSHRLSDPETKTEARTGLLLIIGAVALALTSFVVIKVLPKMVESQDSSILTPNLITPHSAVSARG